MSDSRGFKITNHGDYNLPVLVLRYRPMGDVSEAVQQVHSVKIVGITELRFEGFPKHGPEGVAALAGVPMLPSISIRIELGPFGEVIQPSGMVYDSALPILLPNTVNILKYTSQGNGVIHCVCEVVDLK